MTNSINLYFIFLSALRCISGDVGREMRATRMSVVDFWKNETLGDGLNVRVAHGVNSWPDLVDQLHEPFLNKSMMIEGDVFMMPQRRPRQRAIPVMRADTRVADRITFKEWLREVAGLRKDETVIRQSGREVSYQRSAVGAGCNGESRDILMDYAIKINFRSTDVVRPVLHYLYASQSDPTSPVLQYPVILHANVFRAPRSVESPVDAFTFVEKTRKLFPDATLSLGWTKQANYSHLHPKFKKLSWQDLFHILEYIVHLDQPVMLSVRLSVAAHSLDQLMWLLGVDRQVSLLIWSDQEDTVEDWRPIIELRTRATKNRVVYDLDQKHRLILQNISNEPVENTPRFSLAEWRAVEFISPSEMLSTVVRSERGPAFLGRPAALLLSQTPPPDFPSTQTVEGKVHFLPKRSARDIHIEEKSGLVIYLLDKVQEIDSPLMKKALQVFVGYDGRVSIENRQSGEKYYESKSSGQLPLSECYGFKVWDKGWRVIADIWTTACDGKKSRGPRDTTRLELDTPYTKKSRTLRTVVVSKTGDGAIDFLLEKLNHNSSSVVSVVLLLFFSFFLCL